MCPQEEISLVPTKTETEEVQPFCSLCLKWSLLDEVSKGKNSHLTSNLITLNQ